MRGFLAIVLILVISVVFDLGLIACAMVALLGMMLISRYLAWSWITNLEATRECNRTEAEIGQTIAFVVTLTNHGRLPVAWVLVEDMLPRGAIISRPPHRRERATPRRGNARAARAEDTELPASTSRCAGIIKSGRSCWRRATSSACIVGSGS